MKGCGECLEKRKPPFATELKVDRKAIKQRLAQVVKEGEDAPDFSLRKPKMSRKLRFFFWLKRRFPRWVKTQECRRYFKAIEVPNSWVYCECGCYWGAIPAFVRGWVWNVCYEKCWCSDGSSWSREVASWIWFMFDPAPCFWLCGRR